MFKLLSHFWRLVDCSYACVTVLACRIAEALVGTISEYIIAKHRQTSLTSLTLRPRTSAPVTELLLLLDLRMETEPEPPLDTPAGLPPAMAGCCSPVVEQTSEMVTVKSK